MAIPLSSLQPGKRFELEVLGFSSVGFDPHRSHSDFDSSLFWVMFHQPEGYRPELPSLGLNEELFDQVKKHLPRRWRKWLRLYIAIESRLDQWHGVDAFFGLNGVVATVDVTTNPFKKFKADFLLTPDEVDIEKGWVSDSFAKKIAKVLVTRLVKK